MVTHWILICPLLEELHPGFFKPLADLGKQILPEQNPHFYPSKQYISWTLIKYLVKTQGFQDFLQKLFDLLWADILRTTNDEPANCWNNSKRFNTTMLAACLGSFCKYSDNICMYRQAKKWLMGVFKMSWKVYSLSINDKSEMKFLYELFLSWTTIFWTFKCCHYIFVV